MDKFNVGPSDLKVLVELARKRPVSFDFDPGTGRKEHYFGSDQHKVSGHSMNKSRAANTGKIIAPGTCAIDGKSLAMKCTREGPPKAMKLNAYLTSEKVSRLRAECRQEAYSLN